MIDKERIEALRESRLWGINNNAEINQLCDLALKGLAVPEATTPVAWIQKNDVGREICISASELALHGDLVRGRWKDATPLYMNIGEASK